MTSVRWLCIEGCHKCSLTVLRTATCVRWVCVEDCHMCSLTACWGLWQVFADRVLRVLKSVCWLLVGGCNKCLMTVGLVTSVCSLFVWSYVQVFAFCSYGIVCKCLLFVGGCVEAFADCLYGAVYKCVLTVCRGCVQAFAVCRGLCTSVCWLFVGGCIQVFASCAGSTDWRGEPDGPAIWRHSLLTVLLWDTKLRHPRNSCDT